MLLNIDLKGTEWVAINWFAQDPIGCKEIVAGQDVHALNQARFNLPDRVTAKVFVFRLIYGGSSFSYCHDPNFNWISSNARYWQNVIDLFYEKYQGIAKQHSLWMSEAVNLSQLTMPTGRIYRFTPFSLPTGGFKWPRTRILNYPVQGLGHDLTTIARVSLFRRIKKINDLGPFVDFISTVHDSIVLDFDSSLLSRIRPIVESVASDLPVNFNRLFAVPFNLPIKFELSVGKNLKDLTNLD